MAPTTDSIDLSSLDQYDNETNWLDDLLNRDSDVDEDQNQIKDPQQSLFQLDKKLSKLLTVLENAIADTTTLVDKSITDIETGVPRLTLDLQLMRENALLLRYSLDTIQAQANLAPKRSASDSSPQAPDHTPPASSQPKGDHISAEEPTDEILSRLKTLDLIKARMEASRVVLREAEAWSTLESEVTGYLTDPIPSHLKAAERLAEAAKSMVVFQHTPEYEGRRSLMRSLQNELEASLSTNLVKALGDRDVKGCKGFYEIFKMIEREGEFKNYYFGSRRSQIAQLWKEAQLITPSLKLQNGSSANRSLTNVPQPLSMFLKHQFYPALLKLLQVELDFLPHIFNNPIETLSSFLQTTIEHLQPSLTTQLGDLIESAPILAGWPCLISCWGASVDFGWKVENLMGQLESKLKLNHSTEAEASGAEPVHGHRPRRSSIRRSISRRSASRSGMDFLLSDASSSGGLEKVLETMKEWEISLYEPFIDFQCNHPERELEYLSSSLINLNNQSLQARNVHHHDANALTAHAGRIVPEMLASLFSLGEESLNRCEAFTHGYGLVGCLEGIDQTIAEYLNSVTRALIKEREHRGLRHEISLDPKDSSNHLGHSSSAYPHPMEGEISELEGLDYSAEDWEIFQHGLKLLSTCKALFTRLSNFETKCLSRVKEVMSKVNQDDPESLGLVYEGGTTQSFSKLKLSKGAKILLKQSTLNSKAFSDLLDAVLPGAPVDGSDQTHHRKSSMSQAEGLSSPSVPNHTTSSSSSNGMRPQHLRRTSSKRVFGPADHETGLKLYPMAEVAFTGLVKEAQEVVRSIILSPLLQHVHEYASLSIWSQTEAELQRAQQAQSLSTIDLKILDQFSKSPTELISKLAEGLFNLPRLFEIYTTVSEDGLSFSMSSLRFVRSMMIGGGGGGGGESSEMVISTWLTSLTLGVVDILVEEVLPKVVGQRPVAIGQLVIDLDYLINVVKALDVESDLLERFRDRISGGDVERLQR